MRGVSDIWLYLFLNMLGEMPIAGTEIALEYGDPLDLINVKVFLQANLPSFF